MAIVSWKILAKTMSRCVKGYVERPYPVVAFVSHCTMHASPNNVWVRLAAEVIYHECLREVRLFKSGAQRRVDKGRVEVENLQP